MIVYIRILIQVVAGALLASGYINEEIRDMLVNDPEAALAIQALLAALVHGAGVLWWKLAKHMGWET